MTNVVITKIKLSVCLGFHCRAESTSDHMASDCSSIVICISSMEQSRPFFCSCPPHRTRYESGLKYVIWCMPSKSSKHLHVHLTELNGTEEAGCAFAIRLRRHIIGLISSRSLRLTVPNCLGCIHGFHRLTRMASTDLHKKTAYMGHHTALRSQSFQAISVRSFTVLARHHTIRHLAMPSS